MMERLVRTIGKLLETYLLQNFFQALQGSLQPIKSLASLSLFLIITVATNHEYMNIHEHRSFMNIHEHRCNSS